MRHAVLDEIRDDFSTWYEVYLVDDDCIVPDTDQIFNDLSKAIDYLRKVVFDYVI